MRIYNDPRIDKQIGELSIKDSARIVQVAELFEDAGFGLTELYLKKLTKIIWELRAGRWRLLFGIVKETAIVVNIFIKKTQKTPKQEIKLAEKRLKEYL